MSSTTSKAAKVWAIAIIVMMIVTYSATAVALAVSIMTEEDTSVVRAEEYTTHEVLPKATMPEISIEELEAICVQYEDHPPVNTYPYIGPESDYTVSYKYQVQSGDTLWSIAEKFYDDGCFYPFIMKNNDFNMGKSSKKMNNITIYMKEQVNRWRFQGFGVSGTNRFL